MKLLIKYSNFNKKINSNIYQKNLEKNNIRLNNYYFKFHKFRIIQFKKNNKFVYKI